MKVVVVGTRGIPGILGGVETHCEELYPRLAQRGVDVTVVRRACYVEDNNKIPEYRGVKLVDTYAPRKKSLEAFVHTFTGMFKAKSLGADIVHCHAVGPSIMVPVGRLLGMKVVMTNHGPDYNRQKWGRLAKFVIKCGECFGTRFASRVIVISHNIQDSISREYGRTDTHLIYNGVNIPVKSSKREYLEKWGIDGKPYIVAIGRFVKEKGFHDLIAAYQKSGLQERFNLVIAGDSDHADEYSEGLKRQAREAGVVLTGFIKGEALNELMTNAALFVIPSYHEGLPIALLEAMSYDLPILSSDIPANRLPQLSPDDFFKTGDVDELASALQRKVQDTARRSYDLSPYDWDHIADQTLEVYKSLMRH